MQGLLGNWSAKKDKPVIFVSVVAVATLGLVFVFFFFLLDGEFAFAVASIATK